MRKIRLDKLNSSRLCVLAVCLGIAAVMLLCNFRTNLLADDYRYFFSFADGSRIESISDIFPSMAAHRLSMNGRLTAHALVQFFLLLPLPVFKIVNSLVFLLLVYLIYRISIGGGEDNALLLASIFGGLWVLQPEFGQVFLWLDGAVNYLWCGVLCLLFLLPYINKFLRGRDLGLAGSVAFTLFSFIVGGYAENPAAAVIFMALLLTLLSRFYKGGRIRAWTVFSLLAAPLGFALMLLAPAELQNKSAELSLPVLIKNFIDTAGFYLRFWPALLVFAALFLAAAKKKLPMETRLLALVFLAGSLAGQFVLTFAMYCTGRVTFIALALLLAGCGILFAPLFEGRARIWLSALCGVCLVFTLYFGYIGVKDIMQTNYKLSENEAIIRVCAAMGESDVQLPRYYAGTKYSALAGLNYLSTEDAEDWANVYMAKYYGVKSVIGY